MKLKEKRFNSILDAHKGIILDASDLTADAPPSCLFMLLGKHYRNIFKLKSDAVIKKEISRRKRLHPLLKKLVPLFLPEQQVVENRYSLIDKADNRSDPGIDLPSEPVIWMCNHGFRDDTAASLNVIPRHSYLIFGSLPQFYNTLDGISLGLNGVILVNRKIRNTKTVQKAVQVLKLGTDITMFPEGIWNKSPNQLMLPLWPGIYQIARQSGAKIVPVIHYIEKPGNPVKENLIHTVIDEPVSIENLTEEQALSMLRDRMATWYYLMIERYGATVERKEFGNREECLKRWETHLMKAVEIVERYDPVAERNADFRPKAILRPETVWKPVAAMSPTSLNELFQQIYAQKLIKQRMQEDFQRRI